MKHGRLRYWIFLAATAVALGFALLFTAIGCAAVVAWTALMGLLLRHGPVARPARRP